MNPFEMMSFADFIAKAFNGQLTINDAEKEAIAQSLKNFADNHPYWNQQQKELYKALVDFTKGN